MITFQRTFLAPIVFMMGILVAATSAAADEIPDDSSELAPAHVALLKSISIEDGAVVFSAKSHGCTENRDFRLLVDGPELTVLRMKADLCRKMPQWKQYRLPLNDPELTEWDEFYIGNPMVWQRSR